MAVEPTTVEQRVVIEIADHVAEVRLSRPEKHNALDHAMFAGVIAAAEEISQTKGVRAVVLHGDGPSFCSGLDFPSFMESPVSIEEMIGGDGQVENFAQRPAYAWRALPVPVIAAIHGNCLGGGLQIALGADIRICAPDARLSVLEMKYGLIPDMSITTSLPGLVREDIARELIYTGRTFEGTEALELGVVTRLADDPLAEARALAAEIASKSPDAIRSAKRLVNEAWRTADADGLALEAELQRALLGSPNQVAAVTAALTKQPAEFEDPDPV